MKKDIILVVDYGTSNVRVNAIDAGNGEIVHAASEKYLVESKNKGYAEISVEHLWTYSVSCMEKAVRKLKKDESPRAIAFSFFGDNLIPTDKEGNALNDCILCTDPRGEEEAAYINSRIPTLEQNEIIGDTYSVFKLGAKILWVRNNMPEIVDYISHYDSQQQYIFRKLGLRPVNDYTMAARKQVCDLNSLTWSPRFLDVIGINEETLGTGIVPSDEIIGYVESYGPVEFDEPLPAIAGGHDCDMAMIGMGITGGGQELIGDITGTFDHVGYLAEGVVNLALENPGQVLRSYTGPLENTSVCLGAIPTAGATLEWFMREINEGAEQEDYQKYWDSVKFNGQGNVVVFPTLDLSHGRIEGIGVTTTKKDIFKGVIEALTFENRRLIENCEKCKGRSVSSVRIGGGAANSDEWMQLRADISGKKIERMKNIQSSSLGSAVLAAVKIGIYPDLQNAVEHMVHVEDVFIPNQDIHEKYEERYQEFIRKMGYR